MNHKDKIDDAAIQFQKTISALGFGQATILYCYTDNESIVYGRVSESALDALGLCELIKSDIIINKLDR